MKLQLVENTEKYFEFIRELRNSPDLLDGFIDKTYVTPEMQQQYMKKHKNEYYICLADNIPAGFIGIVDNDLRLAVKKIFQNQGIGSFMIQEIQKKQPNFEVRVLPHNQASLQMFQKNGFEIIGKELKSNTEVLILSPQIKD